ncbi:hypothetical protein HMPREF0557_02095 [Listeria innocua ATCC 33091]|uniref:Uncharacterized protein n=1 Tax=Listeria innocua ATCC 33091 TaxID=1002366 RepID=A0AB72Z6S3_LISIO|nr:hypothetical protein HMPREF0557_02095 [Listeria innocua ATCC 33091]
MNLFVNTSVGIVAIAFLTIETAFFWGTFLTKKKRGVYFLCKTND